METKGSSQRPAICDPRHINALPAYFCTLLLNSILHSMPSASKFSLDIKFSRQYPVCISLLSLVPHALPTLSSCIWSSNNICWVAQIIKLFITQLYPFSLLSSVWSSNISSAPCSPTPSLNVRYNFYTHTKKQGKYNINLCYRCIVGENMYCELNVTVFWVWRRVVWHKIRPF
jgi:hypothetical protein